MRLTTTLLALTLIAGSSLAARADEKLPPDQQAKVEAMLKQEGFTKWKEIELDDGMIEVDDAIDASGKQFDLKYQCMLCRRQSRRSPRCRTFASGNPPRRAARSTSRRQAPPGNWPMRRSAWMPVFTVACPRASCGPRRGWIFTA